MQSVLEDYINAGLVEYTYDRQVPPREGTHGPQVTIYERCLAEHGHRCGGGGCCAALGVRAPHSVAGWWVLRGCCFGQC
jgi:hypothetical protein